MERMHWHAMEAIQVITELGSDIHQGLKSQEVSERLVLYGANELRKEKGISPLTLFLNQFKNTLVIILLVAIVLSALVGEVVDAAIIAVIVVFVAVLGFIQEYRAERAIEALRKMLSPTITVLRGGREEEVPSKDLVPGDVMLLEAGDKVPADARIVEEHSLRCDEASLTGESVPVGKRSDAVPAESAVNDRKSMVFTGTTITYGRGKAVITATAMRTELGKIAEEVTNVEMEKTPLEKRTEEIGKWLGIIALGICFLVAGISIVREYLAQGSVSLPFIVTITMFAIALAVAAVPEALAAIVTGALAIGMRQMAKQNALVRKMTAVETLGCTTVICSDKTGTLTKGEMTVRKLYLAGRSIDVSGAGYAPEGEFRSGGEAVQAAGNRSLEEFLKHGILCNDSDLHERDGKWGIKGDPTEGALVVAAAKAGIHVHETRLEHPRVEELPFSSERKRMTTIHRSGGGHIASLKGAPELVLARCSRILENGILRQLTDADHTAILSANEEMAAAALRVLAVASRTLPDGLAYDEDAVESDMVFLGLAGMMDPPRVEAIEAIRVCRQVHIKPVMITGDHKLTAMAVAREMGIYQEGDRVMTGAELERMSDEEFDRIVNTVSVYARVSPMDKLKIVKAWKHRGDVVAMTGDGVNDAPALKHADIGIAMGISGTEVTKEAADMVLLDDNFATIVMAIERGRWIYDNIKKYLTYLLRANITEVAVIGGVVLMMGPEYLPLLPAAILYINLATDGLPALALGVAPPDPDIMQRPPRDPKESVFTREVLTFILLALLVEIPLFFWLFFHDLGDIEHARTEMFFLFIIVELVIALSFRSLRFSIFKAPPHGWLLLAIFWELVLVAGLIQIPALREAFGIRLPTLTDMSIVIGISVVVLLSMEALKAVLRRTAENRITGATR
ncbi:MAG: cation-translocating P-type ATPase [Nitrospirae bacterium]|nr:cation-translocating P-type ATPase [Nitrospirota bacterium]